MNPLTRRLARWIPWKPRWMAEFARQELLASVFPITLFACLGITSFFHVLGLARYDALLLLCIAAQYVMWRIGWESTDEVKVIGVFHVLGLTLEIFKIHHGCWSYPAEGWTKIAGVPLYSGFMYASVASYFCQAWRRLEIRLIAYPSLRVSAPLAAAIYLNFFLEHYLPDARRLLIPLVFLVFARTKARYRIAGALYQMPVPLGLMAVGFFVWIAENIGTLLGAWRYPNQIHSWGLVDPAKATSWFLLVVVTFLIVAQLKHVKEDRERRLRRREGERMRRARRQIVRQT
ncbi:hypothetical protein CCAX7_30300 [Capsulimonas corticalis]|uniref:Uncharacterized protein n=1 Tax=Capsulimonas corticalis TaxID=2219043 RepID=A0A402CST6_9BACT|nr:DUF817 domain-containing protein [Capsulimonas corticalis]BDI30979.1 hypothetical protein CCAX7_30300 [Capsulimonas corticalis]